MDQAIQTEPLASDDPYFDPGKLARWGVHVRQRLIGRPDVQHVDLPGVDLFVVPGFLTRRDCRDLVKVIDSNAVPSPLFKGTEREGFRTSSTLFFDPDDAFSASVELYISDFLGIDICYSETMQGQRYEAGQQFKAHHDFFHMSEPYWHEVKLRGGQRTWTAMIFLNQPEDGGETDFPELGIALRPQTGTLVVWNNMTAVGMPNHRTLHAGTPVRRGKKHIITKWYRQDPWRLPA